MHTVRNAARLVTRQPWRKFSPNGNSCVEVAPLPDGYVAVRHSQVPFGRAILFTNAEWTSFIAGVKQNEFDFDLVTPSALDKLV